MVILSPPPLICRWVETKRWSWSSSQTNTCESSVWVIFSFRYEQYHPLSKQLFWDKLCKASKPYEARSKKGGEHWKEGSPFLSSTEAKRLRKREKFCSSMISVFVYSKQPYTMQLRQLRQQRQHKHCSIYNEVVKVILRIKAGQYVQDDGSGHEELPCRRELSARIYLLPVRWIPVFSLVGGFKRCAFDCVKEQVHADAMYHVGECPSNWCWKPRHAEQHKMHCAGNENVSQPYSRTVPYNSVWIRNLIRSTSLHDITSTIHQQWTWALQTNKQNGITALDASLKLNR